MRGVPFFPRFVAWPLHSHQMWGTRGKEREEEVWEEVREEVGEE